MKSVCLFGLLVLAGSALGETTLTVKGVKIGEKWIVGQTDSKLENAPKNIVDDKANRYRVGVIQDAETFNKLWQSWNKEETPRIDFDNQFVLVVTMPENARVAIQLNLDAKGNLSIQSESTERLPIGMTYVIATVDREGVQSVEKVPLKKK